MKNKKIANKCTFNEKVMLYFVLCRLPVFLLLVGITQTFQYNYHCYFLPLEMKCFFLRKENLPKFKRKIRYSNMIKHDEVHVMKNNAS